MNSIFNLTNIASTLEKRKLDQIIREATTIINNPSGLNNTALPNDAFENHFINLYNIPITNTIDNLSETKNAIQLALQSKTEHENSSKTYNHNLSKSLKLKKELEKKSKKAYPAEQIHFKTELKRVETEIEHIKKEYNIELNAVQIENEKINQLKLAFKAEKTYNEINLSFLEERKKTTITYNVRGRNSRTVTEEFMLPKFIYLNKNDHQFSTYVCMSSSDEAKGIFFAKPLTLADAKATTPNRVYSLYDIINISKKPGLNEILTSTDLNLILNTNNFKACNFNYPVSFHTRLPSDIPDDVKTKIKKAEKLFGEENIFLIAEAKEWYVPTEVNAQLKDDFFHTIKPIKDPLVIGYIPEMKKAFFITSYDCTPVENYVQSKNIKGRDKLN